MANETGAAPYIAEFVGTFLLVFTVGCNVAPSGDKVWGVTSIAAVLMVSIYALGSSSGGHFNPSVSIAALLAKKMETPQQCGMYCLTQIAAGILAGFTFYLVLGHGAIVGPAAGFSYLHAGLAETLYTAMLAFVVLCVACTGKNKDNQFFALAIGFVVVAGGYGAGAISGGCFNPAVAIGLTASSPTSSFGWCLAYVSFEVVGSILAVALFYLTYPEEFPETQVPAGAESYASEFIGTFFLVLTVGLNVNAESKAGGWSIAASLMCMIFALGKVSGAHFNPAVTVAIWLTGRGKVETKKVAPYVGCQILGAVVAAYTYAAMHHGKTFPLGPKKDYGWPAALFGEALFTSVLCLVVISVATVKKDLTQYFGFAIGSCVTAGGIATGNISGGSLNPAVSVGISSARLLGGGMFYPCLLYSAVQLVGAAVAAGVFMVTQPSEYPEKKG